MGRKRKDHTDRTYGKLTLISYSRNGGVGSGAIWTASCACGNVIEVVAKDVAAGKKNSCGMCGKGLGLVGHAGIPASGVPMGQRKAFRALIRKGRDMLGGIQISTTDYKRALVNRCIACNSRDVVAEWSNPGDTATPDNLVAICPRCSVRRRGENVAKWLEWIVRISHNVMARASQQ